MKFHIIVPITMVSEVAHFSRRVHNKRTYGGIIHLPVCGARCHFGFLVLIGFFVLFSVGRDRPCPTLTSFDAK